MSRSIRRNMTLIFAFSIAVVMALACLSASWYARYTTESSADEMMRGTAVSVIGECLLPSGVMDAERLMVEERNDLRPCNLSVAVLDAGGKVRVSSLSFANTRDMLRQDGWRTMRYRTTRETLVIGLPWQSTDDELKMHTMLLSVLSILLTAISALGAWFLVGRTLSPIALLAKQADTASVDNLHVRLSEPSADEEIVGLVATLNGLLERLSQTAKSKGRFYSAASHELRTPLQALSGHLELALTRNRTAEEYRQVIEEAHAQARRLIVLSRNLLLLYQIGSSSSAPASEPGDLAEICRRTLAQHKAMIDDRQLTVTVSETDGMTFAAPPTHMEILVRNLIENAARYSDEGSEIGVELTHEGNALRLVVRNRCTSELDWDEERILEPFGRPDPSRDSRTGGAGLGLAICGAIASANGWTLSIRREENQVIAALVLPAACEGV